LQRGPAGARGYRAWGAWRGAAPARRVPSVCARRGLDPEPIHDLIQSVIPNYPSILDPRSSILDPRSSILDPRSSILDPIRDPRSAPWHHAGRLAIVRIKRKTLMCEQNYVTDR